VVKGLINKGEINAYAALQKHGKSWVLMSLMKALLTGATHWFGYEIPESARAEFLRIIYFVPEVGRASIMYRLKKMGLTKFIDTTLFIRTSAQGVPDLEDRQVLEACAGADVFMDTLIRFLDGPENNAEVISAFSAKVFRLGSTARTCHIACHTQKAFQNAESMDPSMFRGSGDVTAFVSNGYGLKQIDAGTNRIFIKGLFGRDLNVEDEQFVIEGRPWIDNTGDFKLLAEAGTLKEELKKASSPESVLKNLTTEELEIVKSSLGPSAAAELIRAGRGDGSKVNHSSVIRWRKALGELSTKEETSSKQLEIGGM
jgi:hypothetical protein